ncbi:MAG TPA: porin [Rickettsiales bacterium]|nr:porin [Rickettsiales bacterium]
MKNILLKTIFIASFFPSQIFAQSIPDKLLKKPNSPIVAVSGFLNFAVAGRNQDKDYEKDRLINSAAGSVGTGNRYAESMAFDNNSQIYVKVGAISNSGVKYGAVVEFEGNASTDSALDQLRSDKGFIYSETKLGKFEFGNNHASNQKMKVGPSVFARASGGINGKYLQHINLPMLAHSTNLPAGASSLCSGTVGDSACANIKLPRFILVAQSPIAHGGYAKGFYNRNSDNNYQRDGNGNTDFNRGSARQASNALLGYNNGSFNQMESATKISYYAPRINGWQVGFSFTPNNQENGIATISGSDSGAIQDIASWGLNYVDNFGNIGFALSATGEEGNAKIHANDVNSQVARNGLSSYDLGAMFTYFGFTIGASYGYWGDSLQPKSGIYSCNYDESQTLANQNCNSKVNKFNAAQYYTGGIAYELGPIAASITHIASEFQNNKYQASSFGIDYKLRHGIMPYFEITQFQFNSNQPKTSDIANQSVVSNNDRQLKDNKGYVALAGVLFAF